MKYCSECGHTVSQKIPKGDDRLRYVCDNCGAIHYQNPRIIVGTLPVYGDQVLLCRRAIEPRKGFWTLPAGFMENGETTVEGAVRESWEEARARLSNEKLYRLFDLSYIDQVYMFYLADLVDGEFSAGPESLDVKLFNEADIPWDEIAFGVVVDTLKEFFEDRKKGLFPVRISNTERTRLKR
ncbi:NUDIX hydrolase [uncultured Oceanicoccus sp.]|uniref:NUDIX hydrolase n=1 Tax=uncultured Oceanicoccus sp. TaxID=1706381 RepID=UPI0030DBCF4D